MIKGLFDTFTRDKSHNYDILRKGVSLVPKDYSHDGIMKYLHFMRRYWGMMYTMDPNGIVWSYQFYKAMTRNLPTALNEVLRAETQRASAGNQRIDYKSAVKNGIANLIATVSQTEDDFAYVNPNFGKDGIDAKVTEFFSNPHAFMDQQQSAPKPQTYQPRYAARRPMMQASVPHPKRSAMAYVASAPTPVPVDNPPDLSADEESWFYLASSSADLTSEQEAIKDHIQEHGSWPTNVTLMAAGIPPNNPARTAWIPSLLPLPSLSTDKCPFCPESSGHGAKNCPKSSYDRFRQSNALKLCRMCLGKGHTLKDCKYKRPCTKCNGKYWHHEVMCNQKFVVDKAKIADQVSSELAQHGSRSSDNRRKVQVLLADGSSSEHFEQTVIQDSVTGAEFVCFVNNDGMPILPQGCVTMKE
jgi:hypothetical protein